MALEVIGAGFARTGTTSLKAALEELGFDPCYEDLFGHPEHVGLWEAAARGKSVDWNELLWWLPIHHGLARMLILRRAFAELPGREGDPNLARPQQMVREHLQHPLSQTKDSLLSGLPLPPAARTTTVQRQHVPLISSEGRGIGWAVQAGDGPRRLADRSPHL